MGEDDSSNASHGCKLVLECLSEKASSEKTTKLSDSPASASTNYSSCSDQSVSDSDSEASCMPVIQDHDTWLGKSAWVPQGSAAEVVACYQASLGPELHVMCSAVKNTFLEPVDLHAEAARAMLRRTKSCGALSLTSV